MNDPSANAAGVQRYFIYGFEERPFDGRFLHFERIEEQLPGLDWDAKPHLHQNLHQLMLFERGGGEMLIEEDWVPFRAPVLIFMPESTVHGFRFPRDTVGPILTISSDFMNEATSLLESGMAGIVAKPRVIGLSKPALQHHGLESVFHGIERDYRWITPGRNSSLLAGVVLLLVALSRLAAHSEEAAPMPEAYLDIYDGYRKYLEREFRQQPSVSTAAAALGVTAGRLTAACRTVATTTPQKLLHQRLLTEAKRELLYTHHSSTSIAYRLGFKDAAYFSRFFKRATGESPVEFRKRAASTGVSSW
jgi:AraC family transcriptional activator of pobA